MLIPLQRDPPAQSTVLPSTLHQLEGDLLMLEQHGWRVLLVTRAADDTCWIFAERHCT